MNNLCGEVAYCVVNCLATIPTPTTHRLKIHRIDTLLKGKLYVLPEQ